jgi:hypothetical protein
MKVPAQSSLIQSIVSLQDVSKTGQSSALRGDRQVFSGGASIQSSDIGVDAGGRSPVGRAARPNPAEKSDTQLQTQNATYSSSGKLRTTQREAPNAHTRPARNQPLGQYVDILV